MDIDREKEWKPGVRGPDPTCQVQRQTQLIRANYSPELCVN